MQPTIQLLSAKKLVGLRTSMSLAENKTGFLWREFMSKRHLIANAVGTNLYSLQVYDPAYFSNFNPQRVFEKWALTEVTHLDNIPAGMEHFILPSGLYAVFHYQGSSNDTQIFEYIFGTWLPHSDYHLDTNRPHFEVLGERYKNNDIHSEEDIWIPIAAK